MLQAIEDDEQALSPLNTGSSRDTDVLASPISLKGSSIKGSLSELEDSGRSPSASRNPSHGQISMPSPPIHARKPSFSAESILSVSEVSALETVTPVSPLSNNDSNSPQNLLGRVNTGRGRKDKQIDGSIDGRAMEKVFWEDSSEKQSVGKGSESSITEYGQSNVTEAVTSVMQQLHQIRLQEQAARPLRYDPHNKSHKPSS